MQTVIQQLLDGEDLDRDSARGAMDQIMSGQATDAQTGAFLIALRCKGETVTEVAGFAEVMRDRIEPVYEDDIHLAARLEDRHPRVSARDIVHAAVMQRLQSDRIISVDSDFDRLPEITRLNPADVDEWGNLVATFP